MSITNNYFFVDGSALLSDIRAIRNDKEQLRGRLFVITRLAKYFTHDEVLKRYHAGQFRRFVFYFVENDDRLKDDLILPDPTVPDEIDDLRIEHCGKRIKEIESARQWLEENKAPEHVRERLYRSEKAVDTQICCDALQLAARDKLERLFLYSNDYDFVPLCKCLRSLGVNINLIRLSVGNVNKGLVRECDAYTEMPYPEIVRCFVDPPG